MMMLHGVNASQKTFLEFWTEMNGELADVILSSKKTKRRTCAFKLQNVDQARGEMKLSYFFKVMKQLPFFEEILEVRFQELMFCYTVR